MRLPAVFQTDVPATFPHPMKRHLIALLTVALLGAALLATVQAGSAKPLPKPPRGFFGIGPQTVITPTDARYIKAGGIESVRIPISWAATQPTKNGGYQWASLDEVVATLANAGLRVFPIIEATPPWLARDSRTLPVNNAKQRSAWNAFLKALVARYGPRGEFWAERAPGVVQYQPAVPNPLPIRTWQIWNEANFFYFTNPVSPPRYAQLVTISSQAIKSADRGAKVILAGLFGEPKTTGTRGMDASDFLRAVYRKPGIKSRFDGVALHPYAVFAEDLEEMVEGFHEVMREARDRPAFYITEMGWGSQNNFKIVAFEQGIRGQVDQLKASYSYLLENQRRLNLKGVYWFSWKDAADACSFCDSVGLFRGGPKFRAKPAWHAFVRITGGRARP
jgi:glycosyl hydrolase family 42 (putative beta-galactosidase)